ncbi:MAG: amino acid adenylation domain-containing protein, partial [Bifidobacteriaceae bacterium]|nr:amino acid adenylation domain-containing protein [Bifidobacteriaceae bacterium]
GAGSDPSRNPLFDVMVSHRESPAPSPVLGGAPTRPVSLANPIAKFDLTFEIADSPDGPTLEAEYRTDLFAEATVQRLLRHIRVFLEAALAAPETPLGALSGVDQAERAQLLTGWGSGGPAPEPAAFVELFAAQAAAHAGKTAVALGAESYTYAQLDARANAFAAVLAGLGAGPGARVAVALPRRPDLIAAVIGTAKTGAAWVPVDPTYPPARLAQLLADAAPVAIVAAGPLRGVPEGGPPLVDPAAVPASASFDGPPPDLDAPLYCLYTSGTSGKPKGVLIANRSIATLRAITAQVFGVGQDDWVLGFANPVFDASVSDWTMALLNGASLELVPEDRAADPEWLSQLMRGRPTAALLPPQMAEAADVSGLRVLVTGGSKAVGPAGFAGRFVNAYGPTEFTVIATCWVRPDGQEGYPNPIPIGRPVPGATAHVVDADLNLTGIGAPGELLVAGPSLAAGYLDRPELTARAFPDNPFGPGRAYRTGDLVRWSEDGQLEFLGRIDAQLKIRGVRIEPGEVEAAARAIPGVADAVVVARPGPTGEPALVAYLVAQAAAGAAAPELDLVAARAALAAALPAAMAPSGIVQIPAVPLNRSGKLDAAALPDPAPAIAAGGHGGTDAERAVGAALAKVLGVPGAGPDDDFFALGGDSIVAISLVAQLRQAGLELEVRDVLTGRTVRAIAGRASAAAGGGPALPGPAAHPSAGAGGTGVFELTPMQAGMLVDVLVGDDPTQYVLQETMLLEGEADPRAIEAALGALVLRHPALRTLILHEGLPEPRQVVLDFRPPAFRGVEAPDLAAVRALARQDRERGFDLQRDPLIRVTHARLGPDRAAVVWTAHHLVVDAWSQARLLADFTAYYQAARDGATPDRLAQRAARELAAQGADAFQAYARWANKLDQRASLDYWASLLDGLEEPTAVAPLEPPETPRPDGLPGPAGSESDSDAAPDSVDVELSQADVDRLSAWGQAAGVTLSSLVHAAWGLTLQRHTGARDAVFAQAVSARTAPIPGIADAVGLLINTVPVRVTRLAGMTALDVARQV